MMTRNARTVSGRTLLESPPGWGLITVLARVNSLVADAVSVPRAVMPVSVVAAGVSLGVGAGLGVAVGGIEVTLPGRTA